MTIFHGLRLHLILFAMISSALSAGIFFTFSTFVMRALAMQPPTSGIATMQAINVTVFNPWFYSAFFGPAIACLTLSIIALQDWRQPITIYILVGSLLYIVGTIGITVIGNIPLNDSLALVSPNSHEGAMLWARYLIDWTYWNHLRTGIAFCAAAIFALALSHQGTPPSP